MCGRCDFTSRNALKITPSPRVGGGNTRSRESPESVPVSKIKARKSCGNEFQTVVHDVNVAPDDLSGGDVGAGASVPVQIRCKFDPSRAHQRPAEALRFSAYSLFSGLMFAGGGESVSPERKRSQDSTGKRNARKNPRPPLLKSCQYWMKVAQVSPSARRGVFCVIQEGGPVERESSREGSESERGSCRYRKRAPSLCLKCVTTEDKKYI